MDLGRITQAKAKFTRSKDGCLNCRKKKVKCDERKPECRRCSNSRSQEPCTWRSHPSSVVHHVDAPLHAISPSSQPVDTPGPIRVAHQGQARIYPKSRKYTERSTGCLPCRDKKVKCDEMKPRCKRCCRNERQCIWLSDIPNQSKRLPSSPKNHPQPIDGIAAPSIPVASPGGLDRLVMCDMTPLRRGQPEAVEVGNNTDTNTSIPVAIDNARHPAMAPKVPSEADMMVSSQCLYSYPSQTHSASISCPHSPSHSFPSLHYLLSCPTPPSLPSIPTCNDSNHPPSIEGASGDSRRSSPQPLPAPGYGTESHLSTRERTLVESSPNTRQSDKI